MKRYGMFSRIFSINVISIFICIVILGSTQTIMLTNYIARYNEKYLVENAESVVNMIYGSPSEETLTNIINGFTRATGSYIIVFDKGGKVLASSNQDNCFKRKPAYIGSEYSKAVLSGQKHSTIGTMGGLFAKTMFNLQLPIKTNNEVVGAISMSRAIPEQEKMQYELYRILLLSMLLILSMSFVLSFFLAKSVSVPIKKISNSTKEFAKGNFSVRVDGLIEKSSISEISELAEAFNHMAEEIEKSEEIKNTFISDVSHELRTPMTTISGFVSGILDGTIPDEKRDEYLNIVSAEIGRLSRLVNTFLDITRLQSDKLILNKSNFDICEVIRIVVIGLESKIEDKKIDVELNFEKEKCYAYADRDAITRVLTNIIDNAVKFTDEFGKITITVSNKQHELFVSIRNTGCGISPEKLTMIFKRFYKVDKSRSINKEGTGIGLYLVKNILAAHDKDIHAESVEGEYAEFKFTLERGNAPQLKKNKDI